MSSCDHSKYSTSYDGCSAPGHNPDCVVTKCDNCNAELEHDNGEGSVNPNIGKQFEEIMRQNITPEEEQKMELSSKYGHLFGDESDAQNEINSETTALSRFHDFPSHMVHYDDTYGYHVKLTTPRGWTHIWSGGPYIEHQSRPGNTEDVTNMEDYSKPHDEQPYYHGISMATFLGHISDFERDAEDNFPDDHKPPRN